MASNGRQSAAIEGGWGRSAIDQHAVTPQIGGRLLESDVLASGRVAQARNATSSDRYRGASWLTFDMRKSAP